MSTSALRSAVPASNNRKCAQCGLVNFAAAETCRRCKASLDAVAVAAAVPDAEADASESSDSRGPGRRLLWLAGMIVLIVFRRSLDTKEIYV